MDKKTFVPYCESIADTIIEELIEQANEEEFLNTCKNDQRNDLQVDGRNTDIKENNYG